MKAKNFLLTLLLALGLSAFTSVSKQNRSESIFFLTVFQDTNRIICKIPLMPEYQGGMDSMRAFIGRNFKYPAGNLCFAGNILISFVVNEDGNLSDIKPTLPEERQFGYGMEEEAMRVISLMPKWKPGEQDGKPVKVHYTLPVRIAFDY